MHYRDYRQLIHGKNRMLGLCNIGCQHALGGPQSHKAVVFYCDEGIKGFDAPSNDPMKEELTCNLVLCSPCMVIRRVSFEKEKAGRGEQ
jgi:hypothetical protein